MDDILQRPFRASPRYTGKSDKGARSPCRQRVPDLARQLIGEAGLRDEAVGPRLGRGQLERLRGGRRRDHLETFELEVERGPPSCRKHSAPSNPGRRSAQPIQTDTVLGDGSYWSLRHRLGADLGRRAHRIVIGHAADESKPT